MKNYDIDDLKAVRDKQLGNIYPPFPTDAEKWEKPSERQVGGDHYRKMAIQPSEYIYRNELNWLEGNIVKYTTRHSLKNGRQDLEKARHYLDLLLQWHYGPGKR